MSEVLRYIACVKYYTMNKGSNAMYKEMSIFCVNLANLSTLDIKIEEI